MAEGSTRRSALRKVATIAAGAVAGGLVGKKVGSAPFDRLKEKHAYGFNPFHVPHEALAGAIVSRAPELHSDYHLEVGYNFPSHSVDDAAGVFTRYSNAGETDERNYQNGLPRRTLWQEKLTFQDLLNAPRDDGFKPLQRELFKEINEARDVRHNDAVGLHVTLKNGARMYAFMQRKQGGGKQPTRQELFELILHTYHAALLHNSADKVTWALSEFTRR